MAFKLLALLLPFSLLAGAVYEEPWGEDSLVHFPKHTPVPQRPQNTFLYGIARSLIRFHQTVISPADGPRSHFYPVSSRYMLEAINKYGLLKGYLKGCDRLMRENSDPWIYPTVIKGGKIVKADPP